jgi:integrase
MPRRAGRAVPAYRLHKASGQAVVSFCYRDYFLGKHGTAESLQRYNALLAEWLANDRRPPAFTVVEKPRPLSINAVFDAFKRYARDYYRLPNGLTSREFDNYLDAWKPVEDLFGTTPAAEFTPLKLKTIREKLIAADLARTTINGRLHRIRRVFKWAVAEQLVAPDVYAALVAVGSLKRGRSRARETEPVKPVPLEFVHAIEPHVAPQVWALVQLQLHSGARGGELFGIRAVDINRDGPVWTFTPDRHKTTHFGHTRTVYFGPKAQAVLRPFIERATRLDAPLFSPREANAARKLHHAAKGVRRRPNQKPNARKSQRVMGDLYIATSYARAIARGCDLAGVPHWHPHQLRHNAASLWRKQFGPDVALTLLGDKTTRMIDIYAEKDHETAASVAARIG